MTEVTNSDEDAKREQQLESVMANYILDCERGDYPNRRDILNRHPELAGDLREFFAQRDRMDQLAEPIRGFGELLVNAIGPGQTIGYFGDYELLEEIARGGMGVVFKAKQKTLGRIVAVKMIASGRLATAEDVKRFQTEAQAAANLQHPHIVAIHEVGQHEGCHFFSMDYIAGRDLSAMLRENLLPAKTAATYVSQLAEAIHYAHQQGTLHRDLKPSNILIDPLDQVWITDFGLATRVEGGSSLTRTGQIVGTPSYMPPEQAQGLRSLIGPASDVYSLGAILYECLTGRAPFRSATVVETIHQVIHIEAASPRLLNPKIPRDLETICLKCLEKEPHRRYATAQLLADDLHRFLKGEPISARPIGRLARFGRSCQRNPVVTSLSSIAMVLLLVVAIGGPIAALLLREQRDNAVTNFGRAVKAEMQTKDKLYESYLNQARALRYSGRPGQRFEALEAIAEAAKMRPSLELRNEAIASMALPDVRYLRDLPSDGMHEAYWSAFDPQFTQYAHGDQTLTVMVRDMATGLVLHRIPPPPEIGSWMMLRFSPDGRMLGIGYWGGIGRVRVFDLTGGTPRLKLAIDRAGDFGFMPDNVHFAVGVPDGSLDLFDLGTGKTTKRIGEHMNVHKLAISPSGKKLAIRGPDDREVRIVDSESGAELHKIALPANATGIRPMDWRADDKLLAIACEDRQIYVWDTALHSLQCILTGHQDREILVFFCPSGNVLISQAWDFTTRFWDPITGRQILSTPHSILGVSADSKKLAFYQGTKQQLSLWEFAGGWELRHLHPGNVSNQTSHPINWDIKSLGFDSTGRVLATTETAGVRLWDCADPLNEIAFLPNPMAEDAKFCPDRFKLAVHGRQGLVLWPIHADGQNPNAFRIGPPTSQGVNGLASGKHSVCWDAKGRNLAAMNAAKGLAVILNYADGNPAIRGYGMPSNTNGLALHPDGTYLATGSWNPANVDVSDVAEGTVCFQVPGGFFPSFSPQGRWLAVGIASEYRLFRTGQWQAGPVIPMDYLPWSSAFSPRDELFAGIDGAFVRLVLPETGESIATLQSPLAERLLWISFSADGGMLGVVTANHEIHLWDLRAIRARLAKMGLDWDLPAYPPVDLQGPLIFEPVLPAQSSPMLDSRVHHQVDEGARCPL